MAKRNRILLKNGCSISEPSVYPKNWTEPGTSIEKDWRIQYYFHDPEYQERWPRGKFCIVKGMNEYRTLHERRAITKSILQDEIEELKSGWNPVRKVFMVDERLERGLLHPDLPFIDAFRLAVKKLDSTDRHRYEVGIILDRVEKVARKMKMRNVTINELKRKDLKRMLLAIGLPPKYFNKARGYISSLFTELIEDECCDVNLARDIRPQKTIKEIREIMSVADLRLVMKYLETNYYEFWRYARIFLYSGARSSELMALQRSDVDLEAQEFTVLIKKGSRYKRMKKVILSEALELWDELCDGTHPDEYLFSKGLVPGDRKIRNDQITRRWSKLVKKSDKILNNEGLIIKVTADFYSLKHTMLDSLPIEIAQKLASHTNMKTTAIYQVNKEKRDREELKKLRVVV